MTREGLEVQHPLLTPCLRSSSIWLFLNCKLYNKLLNVKYFSGSACHSNKLSNLMVEGHGNPRFVVSQTEVWKSGHLPCAAGVWTGGSPRGLSP